MVGDYDQANSTHRATDAALEHAAAALGIDTESSWIATDSVVSEEDVSAGGFDGLLIAPGSPYRSMDGALRTIEFARTNDVPLLGTCGGFQHVVLEFARNVLGISDANHAEYDPYASKLFITPLSCSLAGLEMEVRIRPGTRARHAYGRRAATERYYCNFGLNPEYEKTLLAAGLVVSGEDQDGEARIVELPEKSWFVATLFVPQMNSTPAEAHPLISALVAEAARF